MAGVSDFANTNTPEKACITVPCGHILIATKWRNTLISNSLQGIKPVYEDNLGYLDFQTGHHMGVVYATEADLVAQAGLRRKLAKLRKANNVQILVLAEKTTSTAQYYQQLQKFVMLELGFSMLPVPGQAEAAGVLSQMVLTESKMESNPFLKKRRPPNLDEALLTTVQSVPKLGAVKARKLLEHFKSLKAINEASVHELSQIIGKAGAQNVRDFFDFPTNGTS
ncbi:Fanconi anemia core complex-associated protein 24-like [Dreissena polymorpha]|uniref:Fanconi anemia core complex-associated protein 24 n=1 Tax=Dreissena polymorpha TaxID=45954 RepID=A0A9D4REL1_DREPO|nr:Fanconi anemia core complex-associated protein 24-like [Dreissena polymorpha]KAH3863475.1 hypothetical protein DPMN_026464 [Dreissena polymorpha]